MDAATILATVVETAEEHSETPFFVAGGLLALFAVVVSVVAIARPALSPKLAGPAMAIGTILVIVAMSMVIYVA